MVSEAGVKAVARRLREIKPRQMAVTRLVKPARERETVFGASESSVDVQQQYHEDV
jgi:hypothetical protein